MFLTDADVLAMLDPATAVRWMGEAVDAHHRGELVAPPRAHVELGGGRFAFTAGRLRGSWYGYRSYDAFRTPVDDQVVVVHDEASGAVRAVAVGRELGPRRVGALGAVAVDALARPDASVVAVVGAGRQADTQLWALPAVRTVREVRIFSRSPDRAAAFAAGRSTALGVPCSAVGDPREALAGADIVLLATSSPEPVIDAAWLPPGAYVGTLGPKQRGSAEFGLDLAAAGDLLVSDSPDQVAAYDPPHVLAGTPHQDRLVGLGAVRAGEVVPAPGATTVFFSVGLAGTEAYLLDRLAAETRR